VDASEKITQEFELADWRGELCRQLRQMINGSHPDLKEEWKWNAAVWTCDGLVCSVSPFKKHVSIHFFKGAAMQDAQGLFNSGLDAKTMRTIKLTENESVDEAKFQDLVREAISLNSRR
jgi:hypothetical protein